MSEKSSRALFSILAESVEILLDSVSANSGKLLSVSIRFIRTQETQVQTQAQTQTTTTQPIKTMKKAQPLALAVSNYLRYSLLGDIIAFAAPHIVIGAH
jgi:hypothetical protein